jgi:hypothetical protein
MVGAVGIETHPASLGHLGKLFEVGVHGDLDVGPIVNARPLEVAIVNPKAQGFNEV